MDTTKHSGRLTLPAEIAGRYGFNGDEEYCIEEYSDGIFIRQSPDLLNRLYIEVTNKCNLTCKTCVRNVWNEVPGMMDYNLFEKIMSDADELDSAGRADSGLKRKFTVFFGGWGEPLMHPDIIRMIKAVKKRGWWAELITNGTSLSPEMSGNLVDAGLDFLWVSLDGATPESYKDVRLGNMLPEILENLANIRKMKAFNLAQGPFLGIAFVAMKSNIKDLPEIIDICRRIEAAKLSISNVLPFTEDLSDERLFMRSAGNWGKGDLRIDFPRIDTTGEIADVILQASSAGGWYSVAGNEKDHRIGVCPFVKKASASIRWDGKLSPCTPLFYDSAYFIEQRSRSSRACHYGDLNVSGLSDIWNGEEYRALRRKLQRAEFSPCTVCNSCELADSNEEDCFGDDHPACGGCYWQQGFIQCP